jgi:site-specific recombinase XerC
VRLLYDSGLRLEELTELAVSDVDFDVNAAVVMGKGPRPRSVPFGRKTTQALDRHWRMRAKHAYANLDAF